MAQCRECGIDRVGQSTHCPFCGTEWWELSLAAAHQRAVRRWKMAVSAVVLVVVWLLLATAHSCHSHLRSTNPTPKPDNKNLVRGIEALEKKDFFEARLAFQNAARELPDQARPLFLEGVVQFTRYEQNGTLSDLAEAERCFEAALDREENHDQSLLWLGVCYLCRGLDGRGFELIEKSGDYSGFAKRVKDHRSRGLEVRFHSTVLGPNRYPYNLGPGVRGVRVSVPFHPKKR